MLENNKVPIISRGLPYRSVSEAEQSRRVARKPKYGSPFKIPTTGIESTVCHYPIRLDVYGNGCGHDCTYCYSKSISHFFQRWDNTNPLNANIDDIKSTFRRIFETKKKDKLRPYLETFVPIRLGGMTDLFQPIDTERRLSLETLKLLNHYDYPAIIVTKGSALINNEDALNLLAEGNYLVQVTITTASEEYSRLVEPGAPTPKARIDLIKQLKVRGIPVQGRVSPLFPLVPVGRDPNDLSAPRLKYFSLDLIDEIIGAGAFHVIAEFLRLSGFARNFFRNATGVDLYEFYTNKASCSLLSYRKYPQADKVLLFKIIRERCLSSSIGFSVCPDEGDDPGLDTTVNCCGTDGLPGFENCLNRERLNIDINEADFTPGLTTVTESNKEVQDVQA